MISFYNIRFNDDYIDADTTDRIHDFTSHCRINRHTEEFEIDRKDVDAYYARKGMIIVLCEVAEGKIKQNGSRACAWG